MKKYALFIVVSLVLVSSGCARKKRIPIPAAPAIPAAETGIASWYGHPYHGRRAANGEIYDMEKLTAAHRTLPFGTWVNVRNLENQKTVKVRIIDRGPFAEGRIIDLSHAAAGAIGMIGPGTAKVRCEILSLPAPLSRDDAFAVQVGAFKDKSNAERVKKTMAEQYGTARLVRREGDPLWRVLVGHERSVEDANALAQRIRSGHSAAFVVRLDPQ
jgi:rare lipoprotein A